MNHDKKIQSWCEFTSNLIGQFNLAGPSQQSNGDEFNALKCIYESNKINISKLCHDWIRSSSIKNHVNLEESKRLREEGNEYIAIGEYWEAIKIYTKSIYKTCSIKGDNDQTSKSHANRAVALFQLKFYEEALSDCRCAIDLGFPESLISHLYFRLGDCARKICNKEQLELAIRMLNGMKKEKKLTKEDERELILLEKSLQLIKNEPQIKEYKKELNIKNKQKVLESRSKGRYVIAEEDISKNEIIIMENAFAFVPILNKSDNIDEIFNCQYCAKDNIIPFPCYECQTSYCSLDCRISHKSIHQYECIGHKKSLFHEIGIAYLAFRVFIQGFHILIDDLIEVCSKNNEHFNDSIDLWNKILEMIEKNSSKNQYYEVASLIHNLEEMNEIDILQYRLTAIMLTCYLKDFTSFFNNCIDSRQKKLNKIANMKNFKWEILISTLITRHICQMICNAHTIDTLILPFCKQSNKILIENMNLKYGMLHSYALQSKIYAAIYPKVSLYNHSCEPNIRNRFNQSTLIITATKDIHKNDEILNCYGENYKLKDRYNRMMHLKQQYFFKCHCIHCSNENSDHEFYNRFNTLKCIQKTCKTEFVPSTKEIEGIHFHPLDMIETKIKCPKCNANFQWDWYKRFLNTLELLKIKQSSSSSSSNKDEKNKNKKSICDELFEIFFKESVEYLCDVHVLRNYMAIEILDSLIEDEFAFHDENFSKLLEIAIFALNTIEQQYSHYGLEFIRVSTYFLDLIALKNQKFAVNECISMKTKYDFMKILQSFESLNMKTKLIFVKYFDDYIL